MDKTIESFSLLEETNDDTEFNLKLVFKDTNAITPLIREPDVLDVRIVKPEIFIDAESLASLEEVESYVSLELKPQMNESAYKDMLN